MNLRFNPDWTEFLSLLISKRVRFVLVGGHAVAAHGEPRLTEDLDVFVDPSLANAARLREALLAFGFGGDVPSVQELVVPGSISSPTSAPAAATRICGTSRCWRR